MLYRYEDPLCLNGWWDIKPIYKDGEGAWETGRYLVPSSWNQSAAAIRLPGEPYYHVCDNLDDVANPEADDLLDAFHYPREWSRANSVYVRRNLDVCPEKGKRYFLIFEAAGPKTELFINGNLAAVHEEHTLPLEVDVTAFLSSGKNEILVKLSDYDRNGDGKTLWPSGNGFSEKLRGIWQDVYLTLKHEVYIEDVIIRTSVRKKELSLCYTVKNNGAQDVSGTLLPTVSQVLTHVGENGESENLIDHGIPAIPEIDFSVAAGQSVEVCQTICWENPKLWDSFDPNLYWLDTQLVLGDTLADTVRERFGFREVWTQGKDLILNGHPIHLFYDWGHKENCFNHTRGWVQGWFQMMRDYGYNGSRLHTHPHPQFIMDMADEHGIFITGETAIHGSGGAQAASSDLFWERARQHVADFVKRDKNHPSVILWSCENEMRWNADGLEKTKQELPNIRTLFNQLDPTRIAYHEGDSSFWNEKKQDIVSRHYGKECTGFGWWDHEKPLHSGELSIHHYAGPNNLLHMIGDRGYESYESINRAATQDFVLIAEDARANGVCALGPWNLSCLVNLRTHEAQEFTYDDYSVPGVKPLFASAGSSEFEFWKDGAQKYVPQPGSEGFKRALRPFAAIDLNRRCQYFAADIGKKELTLVNDTSDAQSGTLLVSVERDGQVLQSCEIDFTLERGENQKITVDLTGTYSPGKATYRVKASAGGQVLDEWSREWVIGEPCQTNSGVPIAVYSDEDLSGVLSDLGVSFRQISTLNDVEEEVILIGRNMVRPKTDINRSIQRLAQNGKRVILLNQMVSVFPEIPLTDLSVQKANIRTFGSPLLSGLEDDDFRFWGDDPFSLISGDTMVADRMYHKDDGSYMNCILDAGEGHFGKGNLETTPLFYAQEGKGVVIACQLNLLEKYKAIPCARQVLKNLFDFAAGYEYVPCADVKVLDAPDTAALESALEQVKAGGTLLVQRSNRDTAAIVSRVCGVKLALREPEDGYFGCVRAGELAVLSGISNEDLCGIERVSYAQAGSENFVIAALGMEPADGLEPLAVTAPQNAMKELYEHGGASELLRSYTLTHFAYQNKKTPCILIGRVACGAGEVILSFLDPPYEKRARFLRVKNQLERNLMKKQTGTSALDGEIPEAVGASEGFPEHYFAYNGSVSQSLFSDMLDSSIYQNERMNATPILTLCSFERMETTDGKLTAQAFDPATPVVLYYTLESLVPRKNLGSNLGVPDPLAQTFLDIYGEGDFELYLNGKGIGRQQASEGLCSFPDLEIERGYNHILLIWHPSSPASTCKTQWRNILRAPETGFLFTHTKSDV